MVIYFHSLIPSRLARIWKHNEIVNQTALMKMENAIRILAGTIVLTSLALAHWVSPYWLWLTAFVGVNLIQSALTGFCPAEILLRKQGIGREEVKACCR